MNTLIDKKIIIQLFGSLMIKPSLISESDKYNLVPEDFNSSFERYIYASIYNLYLNGAESIMPQDIDAYLSDKPNCYAIFEQQKGITFLQDALELAQPDNFDYYYKKFKKFKLIEDLKLIGYSTNELYCENLLLDEAQKINERFEESSIKDLLDRVLTRISTLEDKYKVNQENKSYKISEGLTNLIKDFETSPDIGGNLQGKIFNTVVRGARKGKYYIRSKSTGAGKTRDMIGDACYLAFPYRFNSETNKWESTGNSEPCLYFATEQELEEIQTLILAYLTDINEEIILEGQYTNEIRTRLSQAVQIMEQYENNFILVHMPDPTIEQIRTKVRYHYFHDGIENLFYDYIFSSPGLLNEYRDLKIREDVILSILSTALKNLAVELNIFVMTSTQLNDMGQEITKKKEEKNQSLIRGSKAIIDKADIACIGSAVTNDELTLLGGIRISQSIMPNQVLDIYKVRRGRYNGVRIWSLADLGTCRKKDLFITDAKYQEVKDFQILNFEFNNPDIKKYNDEIEKLNKEYEEKVLGVKISEDGEVIEDTIDWSAMF